MAIRRSSGERVFDVINVSLLGFLSLVTLYPLLYVLFASVSDPGELMKHRGLLLSSVGGVHFNAYSLVFKNPILLTSYANTIMYVLGGNCNKSLYSPYLVPMLSQERAPCGEM